MRASPRSRAAAVRGGAALLALGLLATPALAGTTVPARAVEAARKVVAQSATRAQNLNATAGAPARPTPAPGKTVAPARSVPAAAAVPAKAGAAAVRAPQGGPSKTAPAAVKTTPAAVKTGAAAVRTAPAAGRVTAVAAAMHPTLTAVPAPARASGAPLDHQVVYQYNALGRRDPFAPLVGGPEYIPLSSAPEVGGMSVVGIVWGSQDKFAIVEDGRGNSSVLRPGDKVVNGFVERLTRDGVVLTLTADGQTQSVTIPLTRKGDSNANR